MINKLQNDQEMFFPQNLIVIAAPFAGGKTHTIGRIHSFLSSRMINLWYGDPITDATYIKEALEADHRYNNGKNHMHGDHKYPFEHEHDPGYPDLHFSVTGPFIPHYMHVRFFQDLSKGLWENRLHLVEWSGGENVNPAYNPAAHADYSFKTQVEGLQSGIYERVWLDRVLMVIHPEVPDGGQREELNERRKNQRDPTEAEIAAGMRGWWIPESGMRITGRNDFIDVIPQLENMGLGGKIYRIPNDGGEGYDRELNKLLESIIKPMITQEGQMQLREGKPPGSTTDRDRR